MAYFDSPKNRAVWEKEMSALRRKKEERASGEQIFEAKESEKSYVRRITFEELLTRVQMQQEMNSRQTERTTMRQPKKEKEMQHVL